MVTATQRSVAADNPVCGFYRGSVFHGRQEPLCHRFRYPYFCLWLALDQLEEAALQQPSWFKGGIGWVRFRRSDYLGPAHIPLADYIRELAGCEDSQENPVWLLGQLRYWGCYFSPVNFYFVGRREHFHTLVAEVSNTPWKEKHSYVIPLDPDGGVDRFSHPKDFHVSPFMSCQQQYHWRIALSNARIHIGITSVEGQKQRLTATLDVSRQPLTQVTIPQAIMTSAGGVFSTRIKIYWQALQLWCKGVDFYPHPGLRGNQRSASDIDNDKE